jgi:dihydrofolate reductase
VVQGLGRPDEDTRDAFTHGGWGPRYTDEVMGLEMARGMSKPAEMLFGRRTWQDFLGFWPHQTDNPFTGHLNRVTKYVASTTLDSADAWQNSVLLSGDAVRTVGDLKAAPGRDLVILGSGALVRSLHGAGLIDSFTLLVHPLVLGSGHRMFDETAPLTEFTLVRSVPTTTGVIIATYEPV